MRESPAFDSSNISQPFKPQSPHSEVRSWIACSVQKRYGFPSSHASIAFTTSFGSGSQTGFWFLIAWMKSRPFLSIRSRFKTLASDMRRPEFRSKRIIARI